MNIRDIQAEIRSVAERMQRLQDYYKSLIEMEDRHQKDALEDRRQQEADMADGLMKYFETSFLRHTVSGADEALESEGQRAINEEHERRSIT